MSSTITAVLKVKNKMSPELLKASKAIQRIVTNMKKVSREADAMANKFNHSISKMVSNATKLSRLSKLSMQTKRANNSKKANEETPDKENKSKGGMGEILGKAAKVASYAKKGAVELIKQSDSYANIQTRIKAITNGQQAAAALNNQIFQSADKARVNYQDMAATVCNLGAIAGGSFKNNDEMVQFSELLTKSFKLGGTSAEEQSNAIGLVTQAMGAGKMAGDDFISIMSGAPQLAQAIAKEMNMPVEKLKEMGSEGEISSDKIKSALLNSADQINANYSQMPTTFGEAIAQIKSHITDKLRPAFEQMSTWMSSEKGKEALSLIEQGIDALIGKLPDIGKVLTTVYNTTKQVFEFVMKNQNLLIFIGTFIVSLAALSKGIFAVKGAFSALQKSASLFTGILKLGKFGLIAIAIAAVIAIGVLLWKNWDTIKAKAAELWGMIMQVWNGIQSYISVAVTNLILIFQQKFPLLYAFISGWVNSIFLAIENLKIIFMNIIGFVQNIFAGNWSAAWQNIVAIFGNLFGMIVNIAKAPINGVISAINWVIQSINGISVDIPDWSILGEWAGKKLSFNIPTIPALATGGIATGATLAMVGEGKEPEAILPLSKLSSMLDGRSEITKTRGSNQSKSVNIRAINVYAKGLTSDEVVGEVVPKLKLALANM